MKRCLACPIAAILIAAIGNTGLATALPAPPPAAAVAGGRWATTVVAFSSQWDPGQWSAQQALGAPNTYPLHGDLPTAWASLTHGSQREFLELRFDAGGPINFVTVYETYNPGAVDRIAVKNPNTGEFMTVWTATAAAAPLVSRVLTATFPTTLFDVDEVRIELNSPVVNGWNEVDAVGIGLCDIEAESQWVAEVLDFSSQYSPTNWAAFQVEGPPNSYPGGPLSWASLTADDQREFLLLRFDNPAVINFLTLYETAQPGALDTVAVKNPNTGLFETVWTGVAELVPVTYRIQTVSFPVTRFPVSEVRLAFNSPAVTGWNEIDAAGVGRCVCSDLLVDVPGENPAGGAVVLGAVRPNPFRGATEIGFSLGREANVKVEVFDVTGQRVTRLVDRLMAPGPHRVSWSGRDAGGRAVASGVYYVRVDADGRQQTRKLVKIN